MSDITSPAPPAQVIYDRPGHGMAIAALVCGLLVPPFGIVFGHISNHQAKAARLPKDGLATAGLVLGYVFTVIGVLLAVIFAVAAASVATAPAALAAAL